MRSSRAQGGLFHPVPGEMWLPAQSVGPSRSHPYPGHQVLFSKHCTLFFLLTLPPNPDLLMFFLKEAEEPGLNWGLGKLLSKCLCELARPSASSGRRCPHSEMEGAALKNIVSASSASPLKDG